jgi:hypothetical protein
MTGRLASRAAEAEALLARFNEASEMALAGLTRGDRDALTHALDIRDALQHEIVRVARDLAVTRTRFSPNAPTSLGGSRVVDRAMETYCAPLEELTRVAQRLQDQLELSARTARDELVAEMARLQSQSDAALQYAANDAGDPHRLDVRL